MYPPKGGYSPPISRIRACSLSSNLAPNNLANVASDTRVKCVNYPGGQTDQTPIAVRLRSND